MLEAGAKKKPHLVIDGAYEVVDFLNTQKREKTGKKIGIFKEKAETGDLFRK